MAKLCLNAHSDGMSCAHNGASGIDVLFNRQAGTIEHDIRKTNSNGSYTLLKTGAVV